MYSDLSFSQVAKRHADVIAVLVVTSLVVLNAVNLHAAGPVVQRVTSEPHEHILGNYFGIDAWSDDMRHLLALETDLNGRLPEVEDACTLGLVDLKDGNRFIPLGKTPCWNFQEAAMMHWLSADTFIYNDLRDGKFVAVVRNWRTGAERMIPHPISVVSPDRTQALSINYARLRLTRPDYGYPGEGQDARENVPWPEDDGIFLVDLKTGSARLIVSTASCRPLMPAIRQPGGLAYLCHTVFSRDGRRVFFLGRTIDAYDKVAKKGDIGRQTTSFTVNADGTALRRSFPDGWGGSHFSWKDGQTLCVTAKWQDRKWTHVEYTVGDESNAHVLGGGALDFDGHCIYSPDGRWLASDSYRDKNGDRAIKLLELATGQVWDLGKYHVPESYFPSYWRCDLHARWRRDSRALAFNSTHEGTRQIYVMGLTPVIATADKMAALSVDVRSFGAVGDGIHDDTLALQKAADAQTRTRHARELCNRYRPSKIDGPEAELFLPRGIYRITGPVVLFGSVSVRGADGAVIRNETPSADSLYCHEVFRGKVSNLAFEGGRNQLVAWTHNRDCSTFAVENCQFRGASGTAVLCDSFRFNPQEDVSSTYSNIAKTVYATPYEMSRGDDGRWTLVDRDPSLLARCWNSTLYSVSSCTFEACRRALCVYTDGLIVRDSSFRDAPVRLGSVAHAVRCRFEASTGTEAVIVTEGHDVMVTDSEFHLVGKMPAVLSETRTFARLTATLLSLKDLRLSGGEGPVVQFAEGRLPALTSVVRLSGTGSRRPLFNFVKTPSTEDLATFTAKVRPRPSLDPARAIVFSLGGNDPKAFDDALPPYLARFRRNLPEGLPARASERPTERKFPERIFWANIGAGRFGGGKADGVRLAAVFAEAAAAGGGTVLLPPRWITLDAALAVPDNVRVVARGRAVVTRTDDGGTAFEVPEGHRVQFENIVFHQGRHAVSCLGGKGFARFKDCFFYGQLADAIVAEASGLSAWRIEVTGGCANTTFLYSGNAVPALFDGFWYSMRTGHKADVWMDEARGIVNRPGGRLELYDILAVPCVFEHFDKNVKPKPGTKDGGKIHARWIDNYGELNAFGFRFGGEWGGITPVCHYGAAARTYVEGKTCSTRNKRLKAGTAQLVADVDEPKATIVHLVHYNYYPGEKTIHAVRLDSDGNPVPIPVRAVSCVP